MDDLARILFFLFGGDYDGIDFWDWVMKKQKYGRDAAYRSERKNLYSPINFISFQPENPARELPLQKNSSKFKYLSQSSTQHISIRNNSIDPPINN